MRMTNVRVMSILATATACALGIIQLQNAHASGVILPLSRVTPGAINPAVRQSNIHSTICLSGYTRTIRPSSSYTTALKRQQLAGAYSYFHDTYTGDFEEDHLISLELGGSPSDPRNLWPEPYAGSTGARIKDKIENRLHALVCSGQISLARAQTAIAKNWYTAYLRYMSETPRSGSNSGSYSGGSYSGGSSHSTGTGSLPGGATGRCRDGTYSYSQHHSGMCSRHGGVAVFGS